MNEGRGGVICRKKDFRGFSGDCCRFSGVGIELPLTVRDLARTLGTDFACRRRGKEGRLRDEGRDGVGVTGGGVGSIGVGGWRRGRYAS